MTTSRASGHRPENLRSLPPGSPAKTSPRPGSRKDCQPKEAGCSTKSSVWLGNFDLNSCCLKMLEICCLTKTGRRSKKCSFKLPKQGLMLNGHLYQRQIWGPVTSEKECGSLPTPRANRAMTVDLRRQQDRPDLQPNLETVMARMLPTPVNSIYKDVGPKGSKSSIHQAKRGELCGVIKESNDSIPIGIPTYLNPFFVEEMMGFPVGWTA